MKIKRRTSDTNTCCFRAAQKPLQLDFSLVELLVVIAIIALLMSMILPSLEKARSATMRIKCGHNLKQAYLAMHMYLESNEDVYPCSQDPQPEPPPGYWLWMGRWRTLVEPYLSTKITEDNPSVLLCPQDVTYNPQYDSFSYAYSMTFYHSPAQIDTMNSVTDTFMTAQPSIPQGSFEVAKPSGKILIGEWSSNHSHINGSDEGWWGWQGRRNYLFADGQVRFLQAGRIRPARDGYPDANLTIRGIKGIDWPR